MNSSANRPPSVLIIGPYGAGMYVHRSLSVFCLTDKCDFFDICILDMCSVLFRKKTILYTVKYGESAKILAIIGIDFEKLTINENHLLV